MTASDSRPISARLRLALARGDDAEDRGLSSRAYLTLSRFIDGALPDLERLERERDRLSEENERLKRVGRCAGELSGHDWDADGGYNYHYVCSLPVGHYGPHEDKYDKREPSWTDADTEIDPADMEEYERQEAAARRALADEGGTEG